MDVSFYPELVETLPDADLNVPGVRARLLQGQGRQVVFFTIEAGTLLPMHAHKSQWGVILSGEAEITIGGETRTYRRGDTYFVPSGVMHGATFPSRVQVIDFFEDEDRYRPRD